MSTADAPRLVLDNIGALLTMDPSLGQGQLGIIHQAAVCVEGKTIAWCGPGRDIPASFRNPKETMTVDAKGWVVTPGFIDCHTHVVYGGSREAEFAQRVDGATYQEIAAAGGGILSTMRATRKASEDALVDRAMGHLTTMLRHGVTTCEIKSGYGLSLDDELKMLRATRRLNTLHPVDIVPTFLGAHTIPPEYRNDREGYVRLVTDEMLPTVASEGLAEFCDVFCEDGVFSVEESRRILEAARGYGLKLKIHADQLTPFGGASLAAALGAVSADHLEHADDRAVRALAESGTVAVLLPGATFFLDQPFPNMRRFLDAGVTVAISTDYNPGSSPLLSLPLAGTMAAVRMHIPIDDVFLGMTAHAAKAIGREDRLGRLAPGMAADIVAFAVTDYRTILYQFGFNHCTMVMKDGEVIFQ